MMKLRGIWSARMVRPSRQGISSARFMLLLGSRKQVAYRETMEGLWLSMSTYFGNSGVCGIPRGIVWAYEGIGQIHRNRGRLSMALHCFEQARRIAFESGDIRGLGWAAKGLGDVRSLLGQRAEGLADLRLSLEIFRSSGAELP